MSAEEIVVAYHERTKHHYHRFAASLGYMDWATQPDPFRRYDGAALVRLPLPKEGRELPFWQLHVDQSVKPAPLGIDSISIFFRYALSLTAWKSARGPSGLCAPIRRAETCTPPRDTRSCQPWMAFTSTPASSTTLRGNTVSNVVQRFPTCLDGADARFPREFLPGGPHVRSVAGSLEVRRAGVPVLPARYRACARGHAVRRGCPGLEALPPRPHERLCSLTAARPRP